MTGGQLVEPFLEVGVAVTVAVAVRVGGYRELAAVDDEKAILAIVKACKE